MSISVGSLATLTASFTARTNVASTVVVIPPDSSIPSRSVGRQPSSQNRTSYKPGRRLSMRYRPSLSVTAVRLFSMSAGLLASMATPASGSPDGSLTDPTIATCAHVVPESMARMNIAHANVDTRDTLDSANGALAEALFCVQSRAPTTCHYLQRTSSSVHDSDRRTGESHRMSTARRTFSRDPART